MAAEGSVQKRCTCTGADGKRLGQKCPSLRRAAGSWNPRHGTWFYQLELPLTRAGNRRQLKRVPFGDNTRDVASEELDHAKALLLLARGDDVVLDEIATMLQNAGQGKPLPDRDEVARRVKAGMAPSADLTVAAYLSTWITGRRMDDNTRRTYGAHIRNHLIPHLGTLSLQKLRTSHIEAMFAAITKANIALREARTSPDPLVRASVKGKRTVSTSTMQRIKATLRKAINDAIRKDRIIEFNPAVYAETGTADRPKARLWTEARVTEWRHTCKIPSPVMVWTPAQATTFLDYVETADPDLYPMFALILRRGPRRGEAAGISTVQADLIRGVATITHQIATLGYQMIYKEVKTRAGDRYVSLDPDTISALDTYTIRRAQLQEQLGPAWPSTVTLLAPADGGGYIHVEVDVLFRRPGDGQAWHPDLLTKRWDRYAREAGLPPVGIHDGRHCAATFVYANGGKLLEIKEMLGHSSISITADIYTALLTEMDQEMGRGAQLPHVLQRTTT